MAPATGPVRGNAVSSLLLVAAFAGGLFFGEIAMALGVL